MERAGDEIKQAAESVPGKRADQAAVPKGSKQGMNSSRVEESVPGKQVDEEVAQTEREQVMNRS